MYYLDPPNFLLGTDNFEVDTRVGATNQYYKENNGYSQHYPTANVSRAFTGIKDNGDGNWCGNARLNRTAKESISVYLPDVNDLWAPPIGPCKIHGAVHQVFARLINDQKITFDGNQKLNLNAIGVESYNDRTFYGDDSSFDASIQIRGENDIQTLVTADGNTNNFNMWPKQGGAQFKNFSYKNANVQNQRTINIKNFGTNDNGWDRISLQNNILVRTDLDNYDIKMEYKITPGTSNVQRQVYCDGTLACLGFQNTSWFTEMAVEGGRVGEVSNSLDRLKQGLSQETFILRNN